MQLKIHRMIRQFTGLLVLVLFVSCNEEAKKQNQQVDSSKKVELVFPNFNEDSAYFFIEKQVLFGPRIPNSKAQEACKSWLVSKFKSYGLTVVEQSGTQKAHDNKTLKFTNIFASYRPELTKRILLTAHWDTRPWGDNDADVSLHQTPIDGANDGGSGVSVILEIVRVLSKENLELGVDFLLFDIEDYGLSNIENSFCYGSQYWAKNPTYKENRPVYGINLDMVADEKATFYYEGYSNQYARHILDKVWASAYVLGHQKYFIREVSYPVTDDHLYVNQAGIPCIDLIHRDPNTGRFPDSWHTHEDGIKNISKTALDRVGSVLLRVLWSEKEK